MLDSSSVSPVTGSFTNPRHFKSGTDEYVAVTAQRARAAPNLVECFIAAMTAEGWVVRQIPEYLNEQLGRSNKNGYPRLREWANGTRDLPVEVAKVMAEKAVPWILKEVGFGSGELPEDVLRALVERAYPWAAAIDAPGRKPTKLSPKDKEWLIAALLPPAHRDPEPRGKRAPKKAPPKVKKGAKAAKKTPGKSQAKK